MANAIRAVYKQNLNYTRSSMIGDREKLQEDFYHLSTSEQMLNSTDHGKLLLLNFQVATDPTGTRSKLWATLCKNTSNQKFVACFTKPHGVDISVLSTIYNRNRHYPLWLSPRGNGFDCHRTWESLYLNTIPIVWNSTLNPLYLDLPIIVINDWNEITEEYLLAKLKEITQNKMATPSPYRFEKLKFKFWKDQILNKSRHSITKNTRNDLCWCAKSTKKIFE